MELDDYRAFTAALAAGLADDARVLGLVAVGSMAERDYEPDRWSDHDFFVITKPGEQEAMRRNLEWLPAHERIVLAFRETEHGVKVLYDDGHLLEFAVFDEAELAVARVNRYRILFGEARLQARLTADGDDFLFGMFVTNALVAAGRTRRGEVLSGVSFVTLALKHLAALLARSLPSPNHPLLDDLDPLRRFERAYPELGAELAEVSRRAPDAAAPALLAIAERELRERRPGLDWAGLDAVRARLLQDSAGI